MRQNPKYLERDIEYKFNDIELLLKAITHRSYSDKHNERYEFIGDALLDVIIGEALFDKFTKATEGQLTRLRAYLVQKESLIELAENFKISNYILLGEGELKSGGLQRKSILADCVEAIIAAIYFDSDFDTCKKIVLNWYQEKLGRLNLETEDKDPKTVLQEWLQARRYKLPEYSIISEKGSPHDKEFVIKCQIDDLNIKTKGDGKSRRKAEQEAAKEAMDIINRKDI